MYITLRPGKSRAFNGVRIENVGKHPVKVHLKPVSIDKSEVLTSHSRDGGAVEIPGALRP